MGFSNIAKLIARGVIGDDAMVACDALLVVNQARSYSLHYIRRDVIENARSQRTCLHEGLEVRNGHTAIGEKLPSSPLQELAQPPQIDR